MGKYLKLFNNHSLYNEYLTSDNFIRPNVSHCIQENEVHYNPYDYSDRYLTFVALEDGATFTFNGTTGDNINNVALYSTDDGETWVQIASGVPTPSINSGDRILWKGEMTPTLSYPYGIGTFTATKNFDAEGSIMSLLYGDDFKGQASLEGKSYALRYLFNGNTNIVSAENLSLPAKTLELRCYERLFEGCTNLTTAPQLPATTLASDCYSYMFRFCTSLTTAPELPATTLVQGCYNGMFQGCTSLTTAPQLPATALSNNCYQNMFIGCTNLTTVPELPATTLTQYCYASMFNGCTSLTTAPELSATTLSDYCYSNMFYGCTNLASAPELPATTLVSACYSSMFNGCTSLNSITCLATDISARYCTNNWLNGVASSGTFYKNPSISSWTTGASGIPNGWTVQDAS